MHDTRETPRKKRLRRKNIYRTINEVDPDVSIAGRTRQQRLAKISAGESEATKQESSCDSPQSYGAGVPTGRRNCESCHQLGSLLIVSSGHGSATGTCNAEPNSTPSTQIVQNRDFKESSQRKRNAMHGCNNIAKAKRWATSLRRLDVMYHPLQTHAPAGQREQSKHQVRRQIPQRQYLCAQALSVPL